MESYLISFGPVRCFRHPGLKSVGFSLPRNLIDLSSVNPLRNSGKPLSIYPIFSLCKLCIDLFSRSALTGFLDPFLCFHPVLLSAIRALDFFSCFVCVYHVLSFLFDR